MFTARDPTAPAGSIETNGTPPSPHSHQGPWNPVDSIFVTLPPWHPASIAASSSSNGKTEKEKDRIPKNPVSHWRVSQKKVVGSCSHSVIVDSLVIHCLYEDFVFSPDVKYVAAISEDGCLRVIDAVAEQWVYFAMNVC
jgi:catabolite repression protein CreC